MKRSIIGLVAVVLLIGPAAWADDGDVDRSFGERGKVIVRPGRPAMVSHGLAIQPDGRIIIAGSAAPGTDEDRDFFLYRLLGDGTLDPEFGVGGEVAVPVTTRDDDALGVALQSDGRILVVGRSHDRFQGGWHLTVLRLTASGRLDRTFAGDGMRLLTVSTFDWGYDVAVQPDGRILLAGYCGCGGSSQLLLVRLTDVGELDATFGGDGIVVTDMAGLFVGNPASLAIQDDGRVVVAASILGKSTSYDFVILRFDGEGNPDPTFAGGTVVSPVAAGLAVDYARDVMLDPEGNVLIVGTSGKEGSSESAFALLRLLPNGTPDPRFGVEGKVLTYGANSANAVDAQENGRIVLGGFQFDGASTNLVTARYWKDGTLDEGFGEGGIGVLPNSGFELGTDVAIQDDGRIVAAGTAGGHINAFLVARFLA